MITFLDGILEEKQPTRVVLNVGGVGYELFLSLAAYDRLPRQGERCRLLVHDHLREDSHTLYGFVQEAERRMFLLLLGITGIGPKIALSALSGLSVRELAAAAADGDLKRLGSVSGIGRKMAERIAVELRHKLSQADLLEAAAGPGAPGTDDTRLRDVVLALGALGYKPADARKLARDALDRGGEAATVEDLVRSALVK